MRIYLLFSFFVAITIGCESETPTTDSSAPTGSVLGFITVHNIFGNAIEEQSGVKVTLEGTKYSTETDASGKWKFTDVPSGSYIGICTKDGYLTKKMFNVLVLPSSTYIYKDPFTDDAYSTHTYMMPLPDFLNCEEIILRPFYDLHTIKYRDSVFIDSLGQTHFSRIIDSVTKVNELANFTITSAMTSTKYDSIGYDLYYYPSIYCSSSPDIDPYTENKLARFTVSGAIKSGGKDTTIVTIIRSELLNHGFKSGDSVYCVGYVSPYYLNNYQFDPVFQSYSKLLPSKNHTPTYSFILP